MRDKLVRRAKEQAAHEASEYFRASCWCGRPLSNAEYATAERMFLAFWLTELESRTRSLSVRRELAAEREAIHA
jgi:hypothetical protein